MMLQGHFVDTLLNPIYRDTTNVIFKTWEYFRGITAPTFFTISGLIFSYLLIKAKHSGSTKKRMRKGLLRGLMLMGIGYVLRVPIFEWLVGKFYSYFLIIDVLQCIGLSLIAIIIIYKLVFKKTFVFSIVMLLFGLIIFISEPLYRYLELPNVPLIFSNYISKANGSVFTILPWFGYLCFGAFIATIFYRYLKRPKFKLSIVSGFLVLGVILITSSSWVLMKLYYFSNIQILKDVAYYNYLFTRLGNVFVLFGLFYLFENYIKQQLILKIGQKTLSIYVIHFIIMYGSFTGLGLHQLIGKVLNPWQAAGGALLFLAVVCFISFYYAKTNVIVYKGIRSVIDKIKRYTA